MRTLYKPNRELYRQHFCGNGSNLPVFQGVQYQEGYGIGNILGGLFRSALPLIKSAGKRLGKEVLTAGKDVLGDVLSGKNIKSSLKRRGIERVQNMLETNIAPVAPKKPRLKTKSRNKTRIGRSKRQRDIFD